MSENAKWYVIHTYSGYENAVKAAIEKAVTNRGFEDMVLQTEIPLETVTEVNEAGVSKEVERKVFPGYVLLKMVLTDDTWHLIQQHPRRDRVRGRGQQGHPPDGRGGCRAGRGKARDRRAVSRRRYRPHHGRPAVELHRYGRGDRARKRTASALSSPCSAERRPSIWSWIRSKSSPDRDGTSTGRSITLRRKWERRKPSRQKRVRYWPAATTFL